jgi:alpha-amylase
VILDSIVPSYSGWLTVKIRNATATQMGQKCWVKMTYMAPEVVDPTVPKLKCACEKTSNVGFEELPINQLAIYPNPTHSTLYVELNTATQLNGNWQISDLNGRIVLENKTSTGQFSIDVSLLNAGIYLLKLEENGTLYTQKFVKE